MKKFLASISMKLSEYYPDTTHYLQEIPEILVRPSFFIELVSGDTEALNQTVFKDNFTFKVVYFSPINEAGAVDRILELEMMEGVRQIFNRPELPIVNTDRSAVITDRRIAVVNGEVQLFLELYLIDSQAVIEDYTMMGQIKINNYYN